MPANEVTREGIIIHLTTLKESDAMVNAIGPEGLFSFYARGINKITSKNLGAVQALSHSKLTLTIGKEGSFTLKEGEAIESFVVSDDLEALAVLNFVMELTAKIVQPDEAPAAYRWLLASLKAIKGKSNPLTVGLIYFAHLLNNGGIGLDVDECVICHSKTHIIAISYEDGGFVCESCYDPETMHTASPRKLKILRYLFRCQIEDLPRVSFTKEELIPLYQELSTYLNDLTGTNLKSLGIIQKL
ncbi:MAG: DNA repair protein RecO [Tenericutes bacterium ADurb.BinA155]|jgi:DNA repair protein RecO (recombination protein O)|nr:MAG: DNA repair protein RecO [Tenericutes bacterium ADurb.BinA155]